MRNTCLIQLKECLQRVLSTGSNSLVLSSHDNGINLIDLFRELKDVTSITINNSDILEREAGEKYSLQNKITSREKEILALILEEYTTQEIAYKLFISARTVDLHRANLLVKFGAKNSLGLAKIAYKFNLV